MSRTSKQLKIINNSKASSRRSVTECLPRVVCSDQTSSVAQTVLLYKLVFLSRKAVILSILLCVCFLLQPFDTVRAADDPSGAVVVTVEPEPVVVDEKVPETELVET